MATARIFVLGFVQGVGFRRFIRSKARKLGLTGWVKNTPDGRVEAVVQGPQAAINQLVKIAERGNMLSDVKSAVIDWEESEESFSDFVIIK